MVRLDLSLSLCTCLSNLGSTIGVMGAASLVREAVEFELDGGEGVEIEDVMPASPAEVGVENGKRDEGVDSLLALVEGRAFVVLVVGVVGVAMVVVVEVVAVVLLVGLTVIGGVCLPWSWTLVRPPAGLAGIGGATFFPASETALSLEKAGLVGIGGGGLFVVLVVEPFLSRGGAD